MKRNYEIKGMSCGGYVSNVKRENEEKKVWKRHHSISIVKTYHQVN